MRFIVSRGRWDCAGFESQNASFVNRRNDGSLNWGYLGQRTEAISVGISVEDVGWFYKYAGRITDAQIQDALGASGATKEETNCFTRALRQRLDDLAKVCRHGEVKSVKG